MVKCKVIDCFCGIGAWAIRDPILPYSTDDIVAQMDRFHVDHALVYSNLLKYSHRPGEANAALPEIIGGNSRLTPAFFIAPAPYEPDGGISSCFDAMRLAGARALWLNTPFAPAPNIVLSYARWQIGQWMERCCHARLPVLLYVENTPPDTVDLICREFPDLRLIIVGAGYTRDSYLYPLLRAHHRLRVCLGHMYIPSGNPGLLLKHFSPDRLVFGSGLPEFSPGGMLAHVLYADISDSAKAAILGGTMQTLMDEVKL